MDFTSRASLLVFHIIVGIASVSASCGGFGVCMVTGGGARGENWEVGVRFIFSWSYCVIDFIAQIWKRTFLIWMVAIRRSREAPHLRYLSLVKLLSHKGDRICRR